MYWLSFTSMTATKIFRLIADYKTQRLNTSVTNYSKQWAYLGVYPGKFSASSASLIMWLNDIFQDWINLPLLSHTHDQLFNLDLSDKFGIWLQLGANFKDYWKCMIEQISTKFQFLYTFFSVKKITKLYIETPLLIDCTRPYFLKHFNYKNIDISRNTPFSTLTL